MKHGDISAASAPIVGVRFEAIVRNFTNNTPNQKGVAYLESLLNLDCSILLLTLMDRRKALAFCYKWNVPYQKLVQIDSVLEIPQLLQAHKAQIYWDTNSKVIENVRSSGPIQINAKLWEESLGHS